MAEYGDPDQPEEWAWISRYSPYQNVQAGREAAARAAHHLAPATTGCTPATRARWRRACWSRATTPLYYENIEGGHGGAADNAQRARLQALEYSFLWSVP
jgi:prolyl oligopeptidase